MTRRGKMLYAVLDDGSAQVEVAIFNELYEQHRNRLKEDRLVIIHGKVSNDDYSGGLRVSAESVYDLQLAREERARTRSEDHSVGEEGVSTGISRGRPDD